MPKIRPVSDREIQITVDLIVKHEAHLYGCASRLMQAISDNSWIAARIKFLEPEEVVNDPPKLAAGLQVERQLHQQVEASVNALGALKTPVVLIQSGGRR